MNARVLFAIVLSSVAAGLAAGADPSPAADVRAIYRQKHAARLVPLLTEVIRFSTVKGNVKARTDQQAWLRRVARELGLVVRDAGLVTEIELPGPPAAPVLGLVVHGDVQPVNEADWSVPPFAGVENAGVVWGRGAADDKGPLVQALLAMTALKESGQPLTYTVRLLVGSDEESDNKDIASYLEDHRAPDIGLVLDSDFPVVVGEKAWNSLTVTAPEPYVARASATQAPWAVTSLEAGLATSIVPSRAVASLEWRGDGASKPAAAVMALRRAPTDGLAVNVSVEQRRAVVVATGRAAHGGMNLEGGRNALVLLAHTLHGQLAPSGAADLLAFAEEAGADLYGTGLGITDADPLWGRYAVNVATIKPAEKGEALALTINVRRIPPRNGPELRAYLEKRVAEFNARTGARFVATGFYDDEPLVFDPQSKLVKRLLAAYERATGAAERPAISGGGTYAKRLPNAIAFGMWFPGKPYPGHDTDERIGLADLHKGTDVLIEALVDLACGPPLVEPLKP
jgi:succinyl-diaminopimelate desuccinylase